MAAATQVAWRCRVASEDDSTPRRVPLPSILFKRTLSALLAPPAGMNASFAEPVGEAALVEPDSVTWRIFKNPVALFVGGVAAVLLELAEPGVRAGVWEHSSFRHDPLTRLRRTGFAALVTVYAPRSAAERMIAGVVKAHDRVHGTTAAGMPYRANDPRLLDWVQATASYGFIEAYGRFGPGLSSAEKSQAFGEGAAAARLYGATGAPTSSHEWQGLLERTVPRLEPSPIVFEFLELMAKVPLLPAGLGPVQRLLLRAAVDLVPPALQARLQLQDHSLSAPGRLMVRGLGRMADRVRVDGAPPSQAAQRLGLPADHLYRGR
jgi:uncharacterized protein (DUF2236 family)